MTVRGALPIRANEPLDGPIAALELLGNLTEGNLLEVEPYGLLLFGWR